MGYFKNLEIESVIEEPDRVLTRRHLKAHRRETYRAPKHWVVSNADMLVLAIGVVSAIGLGFTLGLLVGS